MDDARKDQIRNIIVVPIPLPDNVQSMLGPVVKEKSDAQIESAADMLSFRID